MPLQLTYLQSCILSSFSSDGTLFPALFSSRTACLFQPRLRLVSFTQQAPVPFLHEGFNFEMFHLQGSQEPLNQIISYVFSPVQLPPRAPVRQCVPPRPLFRLPVFPVLGLRPEMNSMGAMQSCDASCNYRGDGCMRLLQ